MRTPIFTSILSVIIFSSCTEKELSTPPNIIYILSDDQGYGDYPLYGNEKVLMPNIDSLCQRSVRFTDFVVSPVCAPTRASLMTGRYNQRTGVWDTQAGRCNMHGDEITIAEVLRDNGYNTGMFGKWHLGYNAPFRPIDQGFQETFTWEEYAKLSATRIDPIMRTNGGEKQFTNGFLDDIVFDKAIDFLEKEREMPFFLYVASFLPHDCDDPVVPQEYIEMYNGDDNMAMGTKMVYGMLSKLDENVGRLMNKVKELGLEENTIIIYSSDNGASPFNNRNNGIPPRRNYGLKAWKGSSYNGGTLQALHMFWKNKWPEGIEIDAMCAHIDLMPTILDLCGIEEIPSGMDGVSLKPLLYGSGRLKERYVSGQFHRVEKPGVWENSFIRNEKYKLMNGNELYDLQNDIGERINISSENPEIVREMREMYKQWWSDVSSTRGYVTAATDIGNPAQDEVYLQFWNRISEGWLVNVMKEGSYKITIENVTPALFPEGGQLVCKIGDKEYKQDIVADEQAEMSFENIEFPNGTYYFNMYTEGYKSPKIWRYGMEDLGYKNVRISKMK